MSMIETTIGPFHHLIDEFVNFKRSTGYKYEKEHTILNHFDEYCFERSVTKPLLTKEIADAWCEKRLYEEPRANDQRVTALRQFAFYLTSMAYEAYIPIHLENRRSHKSKYTAYIFTHEEIERIFESSDKIYPNRRSTMHLVMPVLVRLLYSTGLRIMEALHLRLRDFDLTEGILRIEHAKFDKDRLVPVSASMLEILRQYCNVMHPTYLPDEYLFVGITRQPLGHHDIYLRFREVLLQAGIPHAGRGNGPRIHDLRHTFACHTLQRADEQNVDLYAMLPVLSTYLGHESIAATSLYLRMTAEVYPRITDAVNAACSHVIPEVGV